MPATLKEGHSRQSQAITRRKTRREAEAKDRASWVRAKAKDGLLERASKAEAKKLLQRGEQGRDKQKN